MASTISVERVNATQVRVRISEPRTGHNYRMRIVHVKDLAQNVIEGDNPANTISFTGAGTAPTISSITTPNTTTLRVVFSEELTNNAALTTTTNYVISGPTSLTVSNVSRINGTTVDLTIPEMLHNGSYTLTVSNVEDLVGNEILAPNNSKIFTGYGIYPRLLSATVQDINTIRLVFSEAMSDTGLTTTTNYVFTGDTSLTTALVSKINSTTVDVDINEEMLNGSLYTITVLNVSDPAGNIIDSVYDTAVFTGVGNLPQVSSASQIDTTHVDVVFNETMTNNAALTTTTNYVFSGAGSPVVSNVAVQSGTTVRLTVPFTVGGSYTITVSNVTDLGGNVIDPDHDNTTFTVALNPQVLSVTQEDVNKLLVTFDMNMLNDSTLTTPTNYAITGTGGYVWRQKQSYTRRPAARYYHHLVYDPVRKETLMFGGYLAAANNETWTWNGKDWTLKAPVTSPTARYHGGCVFDSTNSVVLLFGGYTTTYTNQTYTWDGTNWTLLSPAHAPSVRRSPYMAYDSSRNRTVLFGGYTGAYQNDTWEWDGSDWTQISPTGGVQPSIRAYGSFSFDSVRNKCVLFGGYNGSSEFNETWEYDGATSTWVKVALTVTQPGARRLHDSYFDPVIGKTIVFGGYSSSAAFWAWDGYIWEQLYVSSIPYGPSGRWGTPFAYDSTRKQAILFGGAVNSTPTLSYELWEYGA